MPCRLIDGLKGFPDAINAAVPDTQVPNLHRASRAPFSALLRLERSQGRGIGPQADLPSNS